jgi:hypothetical protein
MISIGFYHSGVALQLVMLAINLTKGFQFLGQTLTGYPRISFYANK